MVAGDKSPDAFRTIGELSAELGVAQHILRYWETRFPQLKPLQRAGNRRYYRPADVALARRIHRLLSEEGYTVKGVQKLLRSGDGGTLAAQARPTPASALMPAPDAIESPAIGAGSGASAGVDIDRLTALRDRLHDALSE
ncbi:MAG: MerR family transcriptional regulator [Sphingomicrobium sp.]